MSLAPMDDEPSREPPPKISPELNKSIDDFQKSMDDMSGGAMGTFIWMFLMVISFLGGIFEFYLGFTEDVTPETRNGFFIGGSIFTAIPLIYLLFCIVPRILEWRKNQKEKSPELPNN